MNKKLGLKIIALGCILLLITSLFLPLVNYSGYTTSIFDSNKEINYFPYILIVFSLISIITIILNKKIELTYLLLGSSLTFIITSTIGSLDNFKYFSFGYYLFAFSTCILFIILFILNIKEEEKEISKNEELVDDTKINFEPIEPNELAKSIMDQPVMNDKIENNVVQNINFNDFNEEVTLAPQNPLNSFLPSDFDPNKIIKDDISIQNDTEFNNSIINQNDSKNDNNIVNKEFNNQNSSQSIISIMSQPMVNNNLNKPPIVEQKSIYNNQPQVNVFSNLDNSISNDQLLNVERKPIVQQANNNKQFNNLSEINNMNSNIPYQNFNENK